MRVSVGHACRAFSLIETLSALAIFGLCIVALIEGISLTLSNWRLSEEKTLALMLCENAIEDLMLDEVIEEGEDGSQFDPPNERFSWSSVVDATEIPNLYTVTMTVNWLSSGNEHNVSLTTMRMQRSGENVESPVAPIGAGQ